MAHAPDVKIKAVGDRLKGLRDNFPKCSMA